MIELDIPGRGTLTIENIAFDYNGTLAVDGVIPWEVKKELLKLKEQLNVFILTADTYGTVEEECEDLGVAIKSFPQERAGQEKRRIIQELGSSTTITVGNGFNDILMSQESILSIGVIEREGACGKLITHCDIVVRDIIEVFELLNKTQRIKATLRN